MTQAELAKKIGKGTSTLQKYELGLLEPSIETLTKLSDIFDVSIDYLLGVIPESTLPEVFKKLESILGDDYQVWYDYGGKKGRLGSPFALSWEGEDSLIPLIEITNIKEYGDLDETAKELEIYVECSDFAEGKLDEKFPSYYDNDGIIKGFKSLEDFLNKLACIEDCLDCDFYHDREIPKETLYDSDIALDMCLSQLSKEQKEVLLATAKAMVQQNNAKSKK